ncbi:MAG: acetyl-CoA carboxylase carboxyltransferase subunit alpha [Rhodospirillaceae bacterium]|jgi:acetyl-CoA carboxylase carboxyl transferase subunit alpha
MPNYLDFEESLAEIEGKIEELRHQMDQGELNVTEEVAKLELRAEKILEQTYAKLTPWQKTQVARHQNRPHMMDYLKALITDFTPLAGDRSFGEDKAIVGGLGRFNGRSVMVIGHEKGHDTESRVAHNFGMARPEGYRKAIRLMNLADQFGIPVITFVDTAGAYPGIDAEARGQAEAIARSIEACLHIKVPIVSVIIGEGGSGGAMAIAAANSVIMLEHAIYSVISPEGCASILWRDNDAKETAAEALKHTAADLEELGVIDTIVPEPMGGAHRHPEDTIKAVGAALEKVLVPLLALGGNELKAARRDKFLEIGQKGLA